MMNEADTTTKKGRWGYLEVERRDSLNHFISGFYGFISEVTRFGITMALVQVPDAANKNTWLKEYEFGGKAIFGFTPVSEEEVRARTWEEQNPLGKPLNQTTPLDEWIKRNPCKRWWNIDRRTSSDNDWERWQGPYKTYDDAQKDFAHFRNQNKEYEYRIREITIKGGMVETQIYWRGSIDALATDIQTTLGTRTIELIKALSIINETYPLDKPLIGPEFNSLNSLGTIESPDKETT